MKRKIMKSAALAALCALPATALASPLGGLAIAVSPDGKTIATAGDSRTLYLIDAKDMTVKSRHWLESNMVALEYSKDGSKIVAEDSDGTLFLIDAATGKVSKQEKKAAQLSAARNADLAAALDANYSGNVVRFLSLSDLSVKGKVTLEKGDKVAAIGLNADGTRLAVWTEPKTDASETKNSSTPKELKGLDADEFKLKNDGKTSRVMVFKVPDGAKVSDNTVYYSSSTTGAKALFQGDDVLIVNYGNVNARVKADGAVSLFKTPGSFNYGIGFSADQKILLTGSLASGSVSKVGPELDGKEFKIDKMPGWPEYFKSFATAADGTGYGSTSGYRIVRIKPDGSLDKSFPIF